MLRDVLSVVVLALSLAASPLWASEAVERPAHWARAVNGDLNLFRVTPTFYRSARLDEADLPQLKVLGIRTVVSLRAFHTDRWLLRGSGIDAVRVPTLTWAIDDDEVVRALRAIVRAEPRGPVLLHCQHGADRTGLVSAMYRMVVQGWSKAQAVDEMLHGGYGYHSIWKNIPVYLQQVDVDSIRAKLQAVTAPDSIAAD